MSGSMSMSGSVSMSGSEGKFEPKCEYEQKRHFGSTPDDAFVSAISAFLFLEFPTHLLRELSIKCFNVLMHPHGFCISELTSSSS